MPEISYEQQLAEEARIWGNVAVEQAAQMRPDWQYYRNVRQNVIMHQHDIDALLHVIQPGMKTLELGCGAGWLTIAMARRGADAHGIDISDQAVDIAQRYFVSIKEQIAGTATYEVADLNTVKLQPNYYDLIAAKGVLHHLIRLEHVIENLYQALKPGGMLWLSDSRGDESLLSALIASGLTFILPTEVSYRDKLRGLLRFGLRAPGRVRASMQAEGLSPFEGAGREHDWLDLIKDRMIIDQQINVPTITGYVAAQTTLPDWVALPLLRGMYRVDSFLLKHHILRGTGLIIYAHKPETKT